MRAVLGLRPHTYWTAAVALRGPPEAPQVLARRRVEFAEPADRFPYHRAEEAGLARAGGIIEAARLGTEAGVAAEVRRLVGELRRCGVTIGVAATAASTTKLPATLEAILASHSRIHAAEGVFARDAVGAGCAAAGLAVRRVVEPELTALVADRLGVKPPEVTARLKAMGAALGPPWSEDYKLATLAAWLCLDEG